ncbi:MAG: hypothetical protein ACTSVO_12090 [Candidatus Heimdallarchaeaceae archaeon]
MFSYSLLKSELADLGVVLVKFDQRLGPLIVDSCSNLTEDLLMKLAIKGTSTLMSGLNYNITNTRCFRGLFQLSENYFVYGFDFLLMDDEGDEGSFTPFILFLVFPRTLIPVVGSNIKKIETVLYENTRNLFCFSGLGKNFVKQILKGFKEILRKMH